MARPSIGVSRWKPVLALLAMLDARSSFPVETATEPTLTVRIYDSTRASDECISVAGEEIVRIFHAAGIDAAWVNCNTKNPAKPFCARPAGLLDVVLKIQRRPESRRRVTESALGFSVVPEDGSAGVLAGVFLDRVRIVAPTEAWAFRIVGLLAAHEIGHLLLGPGSHSGTGIMRRDFHDRTLAGAAWGHLVFAREEAQRMLAELRRRREAVP